MTFRDSWQQALYGPDGFYRLHSPAEHFRTSVHASSLFAAAVARLASSVGAECVTDIGAGRGELAAAMPAELEVRSIELDDSLPDVLTGLVIANEWLDNIPCELAEADPSGVPRYVGADGVTLEDVVGGNDLEWLSRWWPLPEPGDRAEIGLTRDLAWADVVRRIDRGTAVAIDYGHLAGDRPPYGSLTGYRDGRQCDPVPDGSCDLTAHVAVDSVAAFVGGTVMSQREALLSLKIRATRPSHDLATSDPARYLAELSAAGEAAELLDSAGLGAFSWIRTDIGQ